jgi:chemotaxis protein MotB
MAHEEEEHEEHVNHEAWVIPYADMLTLLMALFLMLWAMSTLDLRKFEELATSLNSELGSGDRVVQPLDAEPGGPAPQMLDEAAPGAVEVEPRVGEDVFTGIAPSREQRAEQALEREERAAVARAVEEAALGDVRDVIAERAAALGLASSLDLRTEPRGLVVTILSDRVLFAPGSARIRPEGREILGLVAEAVEGLPNQLAVEGHTDDRPIATAAYPSNWELSTARATNVLRELVASGGLPSGRVSAAGYGDERPVADNAAEEGRARNRRVELVVLAEVPLDPDSGGS